MQSPDTGLSVMIANDFVCQNCNPESCALDNFIQKRHSDSVSNDSDNALSEELRNHHGVLLYLDFHQKGSEV